MAFSFQLDDFVFGDVFRVFCPRVFLNMMMIYTSPVPTTCLYSRLSSLIDKHPSIRHVCMYVHTCIYVMMYVCIDI